MDLVKRGHSVETLPAGATFTYNTANSQDLTNYDVVVVDEPNILFTLSEKQARLAEENAGEAGLAGRVHFAVQDAEEYEFPIAAFDLIWTMESSEHFTNKSRYFRNVASALRPGGQLLVAAWTGSMERPRVREVARTFLCPELWTAEQYNLAIKVSGLSVRQCEDLTSLVIPTWVICQQRARSARAIVKLLPRAAREFVEGIEIILDAYGSGDLTYTVLTAET